MPNRTQLAHVLFDRRIKQADLCLIAGVSRQTLSHAVNGRPTSMTTWIKLAKALGVTVADIAPPEEAAQLLAVV